MKERRRFIKQSAGLLLAVTVLPATLAAQGTDAADASLEALVRAYVGTAKLAEAKVTLAVAPLVDNGNSVPIEIIVDSPMTATDHVVGIALFNEKNPQHNVAEFSLTHLAGKARVATRIRLATPKD